LSGKAISMANGSYLYVSATNSALTIDSTSTVTGDVSLYSDGSTGTAITNQGTLTHNIGSGSLYARTFVNSGSIIATAGSLSIGTASTGYSFANNPGATITVAGASVTFGAPTANPIINQGTINVQSGTLNTGSDLVNGATGTITGGGTINGSLTISGGTLAPGNSIGNLTVVGGAFLINGATTFAVELNATSADQLVFQNPAATVNLGAGLLSLNLTLLSAPTDFMTYNLVRISSGGSGIIGTFAGLPDTGSALTAMFGTTAYNFTINYGTNLISISAVPEPSTYALLVAGIVILALRRRRRRSPSRVAGENDRGRTAGVGGAGREV
ncbi:MAG: PEP-CTERM sorting domain-containing protein, partial [Opitutaceae bacterium]|nr:PEP-CTERM sorting domain-containing protein [Opitutaceae bacterium]